MSNIPRSWIGSRVLVGLVGLVAACGGAGDTADDDDRPVRVDAGPVDAAPSVGSLLGFCAPDGPYARITGKVYECRPNLTFLYEFEPDAADLEAYCFARFTPFVEDGTLGFAGGATWDACLAYAAGVTCADANLGHLGPCEAVLLGTVVTGERCRIDEHCAGDAWCDDSGDGCAVCAPQRADGEDCFYSDACRTGNCRSDGCGGWSAEGEACTAASGCAGNQDCVGGRCAAPPVYQDGTPCGVNNSCGRGWTGLYCDVGTCRTAKPIGTACTVGQCDTGAYAWCDTAGTGACAAPRIVAPGGECSASRGLRCAPGALCSDPLLGGVCYQPRLDGDSCSNTDPLRGCDFGLRCVLGTCTAVDEPVCLLP